MSKKLVALALLVIMALSTFGIAMADNQVTADADRKPLNTVVSLCKLHYIADTDAVKQGSISWEYKLVATAIPGQYQGVWYPVDANITADPATKTSVYLRYVSMDAAAQTALRDAVLALNVVDWTAADIADATALGTKINATTDAQYAALAASLKAKLQSILQSKAQLVANKALVLAQNVVYNRNAVPAFTVKQVGNVVLAIGSMPNITGAATADLTANAIAGIIGTNMPATGDKVTFYTDPVITFDVQYTDSAAVLGDYITANNTGYFFSSIRSAINGNLNLNVDPVANTPSYTQAAWAHEHSLLSEINMQLSAMMAGNFGDYNTLLLNTFHGEFASQYLFVYINAPANTAILENTLAVSATTDTKDVTLSVNGNYVIATYGGIAATEINYKLSVANRYMNVRFNDGSVAHQQDLRVYADYVRWDNENAATYDNTVATINEVKTPGANKYNVIGLVNYSGVQYVVIQPIVLAQNPTKAASIGVGAPKDLRANATAGMNIIVKPEGTAFTGALAFESLTPEICTVDNNGTVTGVKVGTGYILVTGKDLQGANLYYTNSDNDAIDTAKPADLDKKLKIEITVTNKAPLFWKNAVIVGEAAPIYKKADATAEFYGIVAPGTIITYSSETNVINGFLEVLNNNEKGYIAMKSISFETDVNHPTGETTAPTATPTAPAGTAMKVTTKGSNLNVRNAPNGAVIAQLANSTAVTVYEINGTWSRIGDDQWVASHYFR